MPWLVVHGELVWKVALAAMAVGGALWIWSRPRRRVARYARRVRRELPACPAQLEAAADPDDVRVFRGALIVAGDPCRRLDDGTTAAMAAIATPPTRAEPQGEAIDQAAATELAVEIDRQQVRIAGQPRLVLGSSERWPSRPAVDAQVRKRAPLRERLQQRSRAREPSGGPLLHGEPLWVTRPLVFRSLDAGDVVWARGRLRRIGDVRSDEHATDDPYRGAAALWQLEGDALWFAGRPRAKSWSGMAGCVAGAVVGGLVFLLLFGLGGHLCQASAERRVEGSSKRRLRPYVPPWHDPALLAAVSPFEGNAARRRVKKILEARSRPVGVMLGSVDHRAPRRLVRQRAGIELLAGRCDLAVSALVDAALVDAAVELARACADPRAVGTAIDGLVAAGRFRRASGLWEELHRRAGVRTLGHPAREISCHLLGARRAAAERAARRWAAAPSARKRAPRLRCLADALAARRGDGEAQRQLRVAAAGASPDPFCVLLLADTLAGGARRQLLKPLLPARSATGLVTGDLARNLAWLLWVEAAPPSLAVPPRPLHWDLSSSLTVLSGMPFSFNPLPLYLLGRSLLAALHGVADPDLGRRYLRVQLAGWAAAVEALVGGRDADVRRWWSAVPADLAALEDAVPEPSARMKTYPMPYRWARVCAAIALRRGDRARARALLGPGGAAEGAAELSHLLRFWERGVVPPGQHDLPIVGSKEQWKEAAAGEVKRRSMGWIAGSGLSFSWMAAPRLSAAGRRGMLEQLRANIRPLLLRQGAVGDLIQVAANGALAAERLGDARLARQLKGVLARLKPILGRRELAIPLATLAAP